MPRISSLKTLRPLAFLLLTCLTLLSPSCITGNEQDYVKYDAAKDEFQTLLLITNIHVKDQNDLNYLEAIYKNRDHLISPIIPGSARLLANTGFSAIRMADKKMWSISLFGARPDKEETTDVAINLKDVKIAPGTFFLQKDAVGYYQAMTVPGKVIDDALLEVAKLPTDSISKSIDAELERRANGGATHTWAECKESILKHMKFEKEDAPKDDADIEPITVLDLDSLKNIKRALADTGVKITREKTALRLTIPLTANDAAQAADLLKAMAKHTAELLAATKPTPDIEDDISQAKSMLTFLTTVTLTPGDKGLSFSLDILKFADAAAKMPQEPAATPNPPPGEAPPPNVVDFLNDAKIPLDKNLTAELVLKDFNAGTLKAYPSKTPITPGEGLAKPAAAPENPDGMH